MAAGGERPGAVPAARAAAAADAPAGDGAEAAWPSFLLVGAPKAGTTALYRWLRQHPALYLPANKQPHYFAGLSPAFCGPGDTAFNRNLVPDRDHYLRLLAPGAGRQGCGEASPFYLCFAERVAPRVRAAAPRCRLVVLLREPVARAYSGYLHLVRDGREAHGFAEALDREERRWARGWEPLWAHRRLGLYGHQLEAILGSFPRAQVGVWLYEDLQTDPWRLYAEVCRFLGVDDAFRPRFTRHNTGGAPRHPALHAALVRLHAPQIAKALLPERLAQWVLAHYLRHAPPPSAAAAELRAYYRQDLALLRKLVPERDFRAWGP